MKKVDDKEKLQPLFENKLNFIGVSSLVDVKNHVYEYIAEKFVWESPYNVIVYTNNALDFLYFEDYLKNSLNEFELTYKKDLVQKRLYDDNSSVYFVTANDSIDENVPEGFFDNCFFLYFDEYLSDIFFENTIKITKRITFFTVNNESSVINMIDDGDDVYAYHPTDEYTEKYNELSKNNLSFTEEEYNEIKGFLYL